MKRPPRWAGTESTLAAGRGHCWMPGLRLSPSAPRHLGTSPASQESQAELLAHLTAVTYYSSVMAPCGYLRILIDKRTHLSPTLPVLGRAGKDIAVYL